MLFDCHKRNDSWLVLASAGVLTSERQLQSRSLMRELYVKVMRHWEEGCSSTHSIHEPIDFCILVNR
jgi:hypothetical protein